MIKTLMGRAGIERIGIVHDVFNVSFDYANKYIFGILAYYVPWCGI
jgi:hypothetical protein